MKNILILIIGILLSAPALQAQTVLAPDAFRQKITTVTKGQLVDVRTRGEFKQGHLANATNIDYKSPAFREQIKSLDKNRPVFVYCLAGARSSAAASILRDNGFKEIYDMEGGLIKWKAAGQLVEFPEGADIPKGISSSQYKQLISDDKIVLIDFYAPWCEPCIKMLPYVRKFSEEYKNSVKIETISYDNNKQLAQELGIDAIPVFLIYKNGKLKERRNGFIPEPEFKKLLEKHSK